MDNARYAKIKGCNSVATQELQLRPLPYFLDGRKKIQVIELQLPLQLISWIGFDPGNVLDSWGELFTEW